MRDVVTRLARIDGVEDVESPLDAATRASTVSEDTPCAWRPAL